MESSGQMGEVCVIEEVIYVALGTNFDKDAVMLLWVLKNFPGHRVVILHVHRQSKWIPMLGAKVLQPLVSEARIQKYRELETKRMNELLYDYKKICTERKVQVSDLVTTEDDVYMGLQVLVNQHRIKRLVMGSRFMSKQGALLCHCQIWLICNGKHIRTSGSILDENEEHKMEELDPELLSTSELDTDEYTQYFTPLNEGEDNIVTIDEEAQTLRKEALDNPSNHPKAANHVALLTVEELKRKVEIAEETVRLGLEEKLKLEQDVSSLQHQISDQAREIQELRTPRYCTEFSLSDIERATNNFHNSQKIGEGSYGPVYKGVLRETLVAIKMLNPTSNQGVPQYQQEVLVLSRIRHPNIVTLVGVCPESSSLIYEFLLNGSVEERLSRKENTSPLSWQTRIRIIVEQRSALVFLHSNKPCMVHADVKCHNILLDANDVSRLGDFRTSQIIDEERSEEATLCCNTTPMGTIGYMDPTFYATGELMPQSDVYSFGIVILRLLTGLRVFKIAEQVEEALRMGALRQILDASAGDWPVVQTEQLLRLALRCSHINRDSRPGLVSEDWRTLEILTAMADHTVSR